MLLVELPMSSHHSEAHTSDTLQESGTFMDTIISLICGIVCDNEQYNKPVGKINPIHRHHCLFQYDQLNL